MRLEGFRGGVRGVTACRSIIPLPLKLKNYRPRPAHERSDLIVHVGTRPIKNPEVSIRAVEALRRRGYDVKLALIGPRSERVEALCKGRDFILPLFGIDEKRKNEILGSAKALLLPSTAEALPFTVLEAMACGTPPVVSPAVPRAAVVHGYNGLRVESLNPLGYAEALEELLTDENLWLSIHRTARSFAERFDHVEVAKRYAEIFEQLVRASGS